MMLVGSCNNAATTTLYFSILSMKLKVGKGFFCQSKDRLLVAKLMSLMFTPMYLGVMETDS